MRQGNGIEGPELPPDVANIGLSLGRAVAQEECIGGVFLGIKNIIQSKMDEMQLKFQDRFTTLETEVRQRDEIISLLQLRIQELEDKGLVSTTSFLSRTATRNTMISPPSTTRAYHLKSLILSGTERRLENHRGDGYDEEDDEDEEDDDETLRRTFPHQSSYLFSRGDSIDTVIDNTEEFEDDEVFMHPDDEDSHLASTNLQQERDSSGWAVAETDAIEMTEFPSGSEIPLWQLEFHREGRSGLGMLGAGETDRPRPSDSVTVEIGNTSTEYESSSSSEEELKKKAESGIIPCRVLQEVPVPLGESDEDQSSEEDAPADSSSDEFDNQNWEVQMLAKEMDKLEHQKEQRLIEEDAEDLVVDEMLELDNEFQEMRDVVSSGALSPTELDMLESALESRTKRVKALSKAFSTDSKPCSSGAVVGRHGGGRSIEDFRPRGASLQYPYSNSPLANLHTNMAMAMRRGSRQLSPAETRREAQQPSPFMQTRKRSNIQRQASLCETGPSQPPPFQFTPSKAGQRRRESAGSLGKSFKSITTSRAGTSDGSTKSIFSRFGFIRTLSRAFLHSTSGESPSSPPPNPDQSSYTPQDPQTQSTAPVQIPPSSSTAPTSSTSNLSRKTSSSTGVLPIVSTSLSTVLSCSIQSDPGTNPRPLPPTPTPLPTSTSAELSPAPTIFTIPASSSSSGGAASLTTDSASKYSGESQPLLKK